MKWQQAVITDLYMTTEDDFLADQLRDAAGGFTGLMPVQAWIRPKKVSIEFPRSTTTLNEIIEGHSAAGVPRLIFEVETPSLARRPSAAEVKPRAGLLDRFMGLSSAKPEALGSFAEKYGPLMAYSRVAYDTDVKVLSLTEDCEVWIYFAKSLRALIHIAAKFSAGAPPRRDDWEVIADTPAAVSNGVDNKNDILDPMSVSGETDWSARAHYIRIRGGVFNDGHAMWLGLLNALLSLGRVRPWMLPTKDISGRSRPQLVFNGPNLLSYLSLQVCLVVARQSEFALCSHCQMQYTSARAPKSGQRNYCPECRDRGVPWREAQRDRRNRLRNIKRHSP